MSLGKDEEQTQKQVTEPWKPAQGALKDILGQSGGLFKQGQGMLGGRSVAPLYGQATGALGDLFSGSGPLSSLTNTARGDYLDVTKSPLWGSMTGGIQDAVNSQFSSAGRTGSPAHAGVMTSELGKLAGQLWGQERSNQLNASNQLGNFAQSAIGMAPGVYDLGNADLDALWQNLARHAAIGQGIGGLGGQSETTTTQPDNTLGQILGIAAAAAGTAFGGPAGGAAAGSMANNLWGSGQLAF